MAAVSAGSESTSVFRWRSSQTSAIAAAMAAPHMASGTARGKDIHRPSAISHALTASASATTPITASATIAIDRARNRDCSCARRRSRGEDTTPVPDSAGAVTASPGWSRRR